MIHVKKNIRDSFQFVFFFLGGGGGGGGGGRENCKWLLKKIKTACGLDWGKLRRK